MCEFCEEFKKEKDNDDDIKEKRDCKIEYEIALVKRMYCDNGGKSRSTIFGYALNYCPECGKRM